MGTRLIFSDLQYKERANLFCVYLRILVRCFHLFELTSMSTKLGDKIMEDATFDSNHPDSDQFQVSDDNHHDLLTEVETEDKMKCENGSSSVGKGRLKICSNADCGSNENLCFAPYFVCAYYGLRVERSNTRRVCQRCYREAENHQSILVNMLRDHKSIILGPKKPKNQMVTIDDEECSEDSMGSPEEVEIEEGIEDLVKCLVEKYKFEEQVDDTLKHLGKSEV